jgi:hypothetical protein
MNQIPETLNKALDVLGQRFGATGAHLWAVVVRQQIIGSIVSLVGWGGFFATAAYLCWRAADRPWVRECHDPEVIKFWVHVGASVLALVAITIIGINIQGLLNPEYYALKDLVTAFKGD